MMILPQWRLWFNNILHAFTIKQHSLAAKILKTSNLQLSPSTSFLRVHVLSLLNYQINWGRSTHFCLQYPLTPQCDLRQYAVSYPQVVGVIQNQSGIHLCKHYYRYRYSAHTALMSWSTWLVQRQTWRQTLLSQNLKTEP